MSRVPPAPHLPRPAARVAARPASPDSAGIRGLTTAVHPVDAPIRDRRARVDRQQRLQHACGWSSSCRARSGRGARTPPPGNLKVDAANGLESPKRYLSAVTTRLAIDHLRSGRVRKESYIGEWLPECGSSPRSEGAVEASSAVRPRAQIDLHLRRGKIAFRGGHFVSKWAAAGSTVVLTTQRCLPILRSRVNPSRS